ncbi:MAG: hypothetical protein UHW86_01215, partial [Spirochaetota bacterium]|nr:hypothetical protein [Spirochaetota bacterium]
MASTEEIKNKITEIRKHYDSNLNNNYLKGLNARLEVAPVLQRQIGYLLNQEIVYVDSRGAISDLYSSIYALLTYVTDLNKEIIPMLKSYADQNTKNYHGNEGILFQMAVKNYPMNLNLFTGMLKSLFDLVMSYDNNNFSGKEIH